METQSIKNVLLKDTHYLVGVLLVVVSGAIYFLSSSVQEESARWGIFFLNYLFTFGYWISIFIYAIFFRKNYSFYRIFPALVLGLISAYSLNREMNIFDASPLWLSVSLVVISAASLSLIVFKQMNLLFRTLILVIIGVAIMLFLYLSLYLIPVYPFSLVLFFAVGVSLHGVVPLTFLIFLIVWIFKYVRSDKKALWGLAFGIMGILAGTAIYTWRWAEVVSTMNNTYLETFVEDDATLPAWVRVAQRIPPNDISNKALKVGLTYVMPDFDNFGWNGGWPSRFTEQKIHNPFVVIACLLGGNPIPIMSDEEKVKILESIYDCRQQAAERLWSDEGIKTSWINSSILIFSQYRVAYTEQVIMVRNVRESWRGGEAVYTFHLPEGSVVTSLSLWVNGIEEKGILTTKQKADLAYRTIVGVEARDPSLVHWQEGSTVSVRVFPVTRNEARTFKIGITSPLQRRDGKLVYKPVYFDGTDYTEAEEKIKVRVMDETAQIVFPSFFKRNATGLETPKYRKYDPQWEISMQEVDLSNDPFCFDGNCYRVQRIQSQNVPVDIQHVYLDINRSWNEKEFNTLYDAVKNRKVRVYDGQQMITVTPENKDLVFQQLKQLQFSLFPVHLIKRPSQSLLVSKGTEVSPNLSDLENSPFLTSLKENSQQVYFFNLGNELSPYQKTLREYRVLNYQSGNMDDLIRVLRQNSFEEVVETNNRIALHDAGIFIEKQKGTGDSKAPDHLMRLFAYNHIMLQYAQSWNAASPLTDSMVAEAQQAYVVSPVSSLVVLETQNDYDRFDIKDTDNNLGNASKKSVSLLSSEISEISEEEPSEISIDFESSKSSRISERSRDTEAPISDLNIWELIAMLSVLVLFFYFKRLRLAKR
jgi:XrtN system VIT domain protein